MKKITLEPAAVTLYAGTDMSVEVKVTLEPENPFTGITWKAAREGIVEIEPGEDGTAILRPVARGKTAVTVTEPGGKKANVTVAVTSPVEQVELNASGKAKPGKTITVRTTLLPKTAGVKDVEWFVDTDESIASVNSKGQVSIAKDTPTGTVVTVTCKALGAPEPVSAELKIIVE